MLTAIASAEARGLRSDDANQLRILVDGIRILVDDRAYEEAAMEVAELAAEIDRLEASGDLVNAGELRNVLGKLQVALPSARS